MGRRGAYRKEERVGLPKELQMELVEKAAARHGNCQELAKWLGVPKSSVHYYRTGRLTLPASVLERMLEDAGDDGLERRVREAARDLDRTWANYYSSGIMREMYRQRVRLPTVEELERDDDLRRKAAAVVSYVMAEGSIWTKRNRFDEGIVNITFAEHETDLYDHFRRLCMDVFDYDIGPPQLPGNGTKAIRGFIYSRFVAEWLEDKGVARGDKSACAMRIPSWVSETTDIGTMRSALQPWLDGEGSVSQSNRRSPPSFSLSQSRHTDLDEGDLTSDYMHPKFRYVPRGTLAPISLRGLPAIEYCERFCRSEVMDDVMTLLKRVGFKSTITLSRLYLKGDGRWSGVWTIRMGPSEATRLPKAGLVTQARKMSQLRWPDII